MFLPQKVREGRAKKTRARKKETVKSRNKGK
jgi:hypothetical protein